MEAEGLAGVKQITFGEKERGLEFPCLFVLPGEDNDEDVSMPNIQEHRMPFEVVAIVKDPDIQAGLRNAIQLGGAVVDALKADRTITGSCLYSEFGKLNPGYGKNEKGTVLHWCSVKVTAIIAGIREAI